MAGKNFKLRLRSMQTSSPRHQSVEELSQMARNQTCRVAFQHRMEAADASNALTSTHATIPRMGPVPEEAS